MGAATKYAGHQSLGRDFTQVIGAANTNGGERCLHAISLLVHITDRAGDGAEASLDETHRGAVLLPIGSLETVVADLEDGVGLERNDGTVGQPQLGIAVGAGGDGIAHEDIGTARQGTGCPVQGGRDLASDLHHEADTAFLGCLSGGHHEQQCQTDILEIAEQGL